MRRIAWLAAESPATKAFRSEFATGEPPAGDRAELLPAWFREHCPELFTPVELAVQLQRPPLWLRLQTDETGRDRALAELTQRGWEVRPSSVLPDAFEVKTEADLTNTTAWCEGAIEIQDLGSQMVLESIGIEPGTRWLDACAGAGGKSLQLARLTGASGRVDAYDIRPDALHELRTRAVRARLDRINVLTAAATGTYDGVLVDAPCSGSGTWRRQPHLKWTTTPAFVAGRARLQETLLAANAARVRPGGRLVYATCSLSRLENEAVVAAFLGAHPDFSPAPFRTTFGFEPRGDGITLLPSRYNTDGFFVSSLVRR